MESTANRSDIRSTVVPASADAVFAALAQPERIARWWGPDGFRSTIHCFDLQPGGQWLLTMHGPDGKDYPNESRFTRVEPGRLFEIEHLNGHHFLLTITLQPQGDATRVEWCQTFDTVEHYRKIADFVASANAQNLQRLAAEVQRAAPMPPETLLRHVDEASLWPVAGADARRSDVAAAYQDALAVRRLRTARGERPAGFKIGFTNRTIWERYAVHAPIWGTVWDTTLARCDGDGVLDLAGTCQPRLEPEIAFGLRATPPADADLPSLFTCVDWLAPSFEVVQSHCADWKFNAAETVADGALHARLLLGRTTPVRAIADSGAALDALLAGTRLTLWQGARRVDEGQGHNVLDGPLHALLHFVRELQRCPGAPALRAGDVVTTGTWTDAWPITPGETWRTEIDAPLLPLQVRLR